MLCRTAQDSMNGFKRRAAAAPAGGSGEWRLDALVVPCFALFYQSGAVIGMPRLGVKLLIRGPGAGTTIFSGV
jgi:hypothetical protein